MLGKTAFGIHRSTGGRLVNRPIPSRSPLAYFIHVALKGTQEMEVDGVRVCLAPGEHTLTHASKAFTREAGDDILVACLAVPREVMRRYVADPENVVGHVWPATGLSGSIGRMLQSMHEMGETGTLDAFGSRVAVHALDLFGLCSQAVAKAGSRLERLEHIKSFVRSNVHDPALSIATVADRFSISARYLHMLFAAENESLSTFIRHERLERCRLSLEDPRWQGRSISDVAFAWGFNDLSNFCRTFRSKYGVSASAYRRRAAGEEAAFNA